jgi:hypothetical protein
MLLLVVVEGSVVSTLGRDVGLEVAMGPRMMDEEDRVTPPTQTHISRTSRLMDLADGRRGMGAPSLGMTLGGGPLYGGRA